MSPQHITAILNEIDRGEKSEEPARGRPINVRTKTGQFYPNCSVKVLPEDRYMDGERNPKAPLSILIIKPEKFSSAIFLDVETIESIQRYTGI